MEHIKMADPSRGFKSLRKKRAPPRPKISAPVPAGAPPTREQNANLERMQRRMSQRLMQPITLDNAPPVPMLPSLPLGSGRNSTSAAPPPARDIGHGGPLVDMAAIEDPHLNPEAYAMSVLRNATAQQVDDYEKALAKTQNRNSADITDSVHKNVDAFINVSIESKNIKSEMDNLRNYLSELRLLVAQNNAALGVADDSSSRRQANRSSIANLEAMWSTHLQELWKRVEGSQRYLAAIPGRHIVHESGKWIQLNSATLKPRRRVHLILLNDHLLIAVEKIRPVAPQNGEAKVQQVPVYVTDRCWALQDVDISEVASKPASVRGADPSPQAIIVRVGDETFTYAATDRGAGEKAAFLARSRKASADLNKAVQLENDERLASRPISMKPRDNARKHLSMSLVDNPATAKASMLVEVNGRQETFRWVEGQVYELEIDVALQRFNEAVKRIEKLRSIAKSNKSNQAVQELVSIRVQSHVERLVEWLTSYLTIEHKAQSHVQEYTALLSRLELEHLASTTYLQARGQWIQDLIEYVFP